MSDVAAQSVCVESHLATVGPSLFFFLLVDCQIARTLGRVTGDEAIDPMNQTTRKFLAKLTDLAAVEY